MVDALMVTSSFLPGQGGIESYLAELCGELAPRLAVLAPAARDGNPLPRDLPYRTEAGPAGMLVPRPAVAKAIVEAAARVGTDRILFGTPWPLLLVAPALLRAGLRYAVIAHGAELIVPAAVPLASNRMASALARADAVFAVSEFTRGHVRELLEKKGRRAPALELLRARVDTDRFTPDVDTSEARERYGISDTDKVVLCFGRLVPRKGVDRLIRIMELVHERVPEAVLVVAGTGSEEERLQELARDSRGRVVFTGRVPDDLVPPVYAMADAFALAVADRYGGLEAEGLGIVLLEAAACEVPCVTGRSGGTPEAVIEGKTGFVVDAAETEKFADRIAGLLENEHLARQMGKAGRTHVTENFSGQGRLRPLVDWMGSASDS